MTEAFADDRKMDGRNGRFRLSCNGGAGTDGKPEGGGGWRRQGGEIGGGKIGRKERASDGSGEEMEGRELGKKGRR